MTSVRPRPALACHVPAVLLAACLGLFGPAGCSDNNPAGPDDCSDGLDNDGDGSIDFADPGCVLNNGLAEIPDPETFACDDDTDNDGDGFIDYPDDPGCDNPDDRSERNEPTPQCNDGIDNDGDGRIDFPNDPGCFNRFANNETDFCPVDARCPKCGNRWDDDGDGRIDYPDDPGCDAASDNDEFNADITNCGPDVSIEPLAPGSEAMGSVALEGQNQLVSPTCGGLGQEHVYLLDVPEATILDVTTAFPQTTLDTVLYLRGVCRDITTELACSDDAEDLSSRFLVAVEPGTYFLVVDAFHSTSEGNYRVRVDTYLPQGGACDPAMPGCAPGYECRPVDDNATEPTCELPTCADGLDNDFDGYIDYPNEPGCESPADSDEHDDCPSGASCPACGNNQDDDSDGATDYPADLGCESAADGVEVNCEDELDSIGVVDATSVFGNTTGASDDFTPACAFSSGAPDHVWMLDVPFPLASLQIDTRNSAFDTVLSIRTPTCDHPDLACNDNGSGFQSVIQLAGVAPSQYLILVDGAGSANGSYQLRTHGAISAGSTCDPALEASGLFTCVDGYTCVGNTCVPAQCNNALDDDMDGLIDVSEDPGCANSSDNDELDECPMGPTCPACANSLDDDSDGAIDYPNDLGCLFPGDDTEEDCNEESDPVTVLTAGTVAGTTTGATHDFTPSCAFTNTAPDRTFALIATSPLLSLHVDTEGSSFDTMLAIKTPTCGDADIACDNDSGTGARSSIDLTNVAAGAYFIVVDGFSTSSGPFTLNVHGVIPAGGACDPATIASGLFSCEPNFACDSTVCAPAACVNGADDDSDGAIDFPDDPGCASPGDTDEYDDCMTMGPNCPRCGNGMDDDGDGAIDYPADPGCVSASDNVEEDCMDSDPMAHITLPVVSGTTVGATDDFTPSCSASNAPERVYVLDIPGTLQTLELNTNSSTYDTILYVRQPACTAADLACDDNSSGSGQSAISLVNVPPGPLFIFIDGYMSNAGSYVLQLYGVIAAGEACDPAQISAGILACAPGTNCIDPGTGFSCQ